MTNPTTEDLVQVETVVERLVAGLSRPNDEPLPALMLVCLRDSSKAMLRVYGLPIPDDTWLDEFIREMCDWHDMPVAS